MIRDALGARPLGAVSCGDVAPSARPAGGEQMSTIVRPGRPAQEPLHAAGSLSITRPRRRLLWWREVLIFAAAYLAYEALRWLGTGAKPIAVENAKHLFDLENSMGIAFEAGLQRALEGTTILWAMGWIYLAAQTLALIAGVVTCFFLAPRVYRRLRNTLIVMWMLALPVYAALPTAPPRLAGVGLADSVTDATGIALDSPSILMFYNPYAAVPSLHAGFALAVGIGVALGTKRWWLRAIGIHRGPGVIVSTVGPGGHGLDVRDRQPLRARRGRGHRDRRDRVRDRARPRAAGALGAVPPARALAAAGARQAAGHKPAAVHPCQRSTVIHALTRGLVRLR